MSLTRRPRTTEAPDAVDADAPNTRQPRQPLAAMGPELQRQWLQGTADPAALPQDPSALPSTGYEAATQRLAPEPVGEPGALPASSLVGLKRGDGMTGDTADKRPRVMELQRRMNQALRGGQNWVDGKFGPMTGQELREFQASIRQPSAEVVDPVTAAALDGKAPAGPAGQKVGPSEVAEPDRKAFVGLGKAMRDLEVKLLAAGRRLHGASMQIKAHDDTEGAPKVAAHLEAAALHKGSAVQEARNAADALGDAGTPEQAPNKAVGNGLVGLRLGDGLLFPFHRRGRVTELQKALNANVGAGLVPDGRFGAITATALNGFQDKEGLAVRDVVDADAADLLFEQAPHIPPAGGTEAQPLVKSGGHFGQAAQAAGGAGLAFSTASMGFRPVGPTAMVPQELRGVGIIWDSIGLSLSEAQRLFQGITVGAVGLEMRANLRSVSQSLASIAGLFASAAQELEAGGKVWEFRAGVESLAGQSFISAGNAIGACGNQLGQAAPPLNRRGPTGDPKDG